MKAVRLYQFGPPNNLVYDDVPDPAPGRGQLRIAVQASGVHVIDTSLRAGDRARPVPLPELPVILGRDVAGTVDAVGDGVDDSWVGQRVVAYLGEASGGYAELAVTAVDAVHRLPDELSAEAAAAMIGTGRTAVGVLDQAALTADDVVLVTAAAGGVGILFLQAARRVGAIAVGAAGGADKVARVTEHGATFAVDYTKPDWPAQVRAALGDREVSIVLDGVGGKLGRAAMDLLGPGGRLLMFGWASGERIQFTSDDVIEHGLTATWAIPRMLQRPGGLRGLEAQALAEAAAGRLAPAVQQFPLQHAADAHQAIEDRATTGKVVLVPQ